jgi:hypothetical protein
MNVSLLPNPNQTKKQDFAHQYIHPRITSSSALLPSCLLHRQDALGKRRAVDCGVVEAAFVLHRVCETRVSEINGAFQADK